MIKKVNEAKIRDFIANRITDLRSFIMNYDEVRQRLINAENNFLQISTEEGGPTAKDLIKEIIGRRNLQGLNRLYDLKLIATEFPLLSSSKPGKKPSADLLALNQETGTLFLIEIKKSPQTERESIMELSAYTQGLQKRYWGLSSADLIWIPICTDWRLTVSEAFSYHIVWNQESILPMEALLNIVDDKIESISLSILNLVTDFPEELALSLFSWATFDGLSINLPIRPSDPRNFVNFIVSTASRLGYSGFVLYTSSNLSNNIPYPFGFLVGTYNPFKGFLKRKQLQIVRESTDIIEMRKHVKKPLWFGHDVDFKTGDDLWDDFNSFLDNINNEEKNTISTSELSSSSENRISPLYKELKSRLNLFVKDFEISSPDVHSLLYDKNFHLLNFVEFVAYFGIMQEAVYDRLRYEFHHSSESGDGPILGDLGGDPLRLSSSFTFFSDFMDLMNYDHECQVRYYEEYNQDSE